MDLVKNPGKEIMSSNFNSTSLFSELHLIASDLTSILDIKHISLNKVSQSKLDLIF